MEPARRVPHAGVLVALHDHTPGHGPVRAHPHRLGAPSAVGQRSPPAVPPAGVRRARSVIVADEEPPGGGGGVQEVGLVVDPAPPALRHGVDRLLRAVPGPHRGVVRAERPDTPAVVLGPGQAHRGEAAFGEAVLVATVVDVQRAVRAEAHEARIVLQRADHVLDVEPGTGGEQEGRQHHRRPPRRSLRCPGSRCRR